MISPESKKTKNLLEDCDYTIPKYQRKFEWNTDHAKDFWEDVDFITKENRKPDKDLDFFIGTILLKKNNSKDSFEIIDGQQRITTVTLFLIAMRQHLKSIEFTAKTTKEVRYDQSRIQSLIINDEDQPRVTPSPSISYVFNKMCSFEWDGEPIFNRDDGTGVKLEWNRIAKVYNSFKTNIEKIGTDSKSLIALTETVLNIDFLTLIVETEEDAYHIFETTNARGLELSIADLLKNYLFMKLDDVESDWEKICSNTTGKGSSLVQAIKFFYTSEDGYITKKQLYRELKAFRGDNPQKLLDDLKLFSEFYKVYMNPRDYKSFKSWFKKNIYNPNSEEKLQTIYQSFNALRLFGVTQTAPLIFSFLSKFKNLGMQNKDKYKSLPMEFIEQLENYHFINNFICDNVGNEVERDYAQWSKEFFNLDSKNEVHTKLKEITHKLFSQRLVTNGEFIESFIKYEYEDNSDKKEAIRYMFNKFNKKYRSKRSNANIWNPEDRLEKAKKPNFDIEHWAPQSRPKNDEKYANIWETKVQPNNVLNSIGNLFVITSGFNSELSNFSPNRKYSEIVKDKNIEEYKFFYEIDKYKDDLSQWDNNNIETRAKDLADDAYKRAWRFKPF